MTAYCTRCPNRLDTAAVLTGFDWCTDCERKALDTAIRLRDEGQALASAAHPTERAAVESAIRKLAATGRPFSANDARAIHGVKGGVVGAAFTALNKAGVIKSFGGERTASTSAATHGHAVHLWVGSEAA